MSKNFSVEWLSQSFHAQQLDQDNGGNSYKPYGDLPKASTNIGLLDLVGQDHKGEKKAPSSPTNSCGYTTASESDAGDDSEGESGPHRRARTKFTSDQISRLEKTFNKHKYLGATQRRKIAEKLHLSETQVKTWFQNRRMKLKRQVQDMRTEYFTPPVAFAPASFQHHAMSGQRLSLYYPHQQPLQRIPVQQMQQQQHIHQILFAPCYY